MGTSNFAVPALSELAKKHSVQAVFTQKSKAQGRGLNIKLSPVHQLADSLCIPVHTPGTLKSNEVLELINSIDADVIVVCSYGFIIPKTILEAKKYGCLNIHPSLLPKYRGAAPLQRAIINGDDKTAVCIMQMDEGLDTGPIILQQDFAIDENINYTQLHDKCAAIGASLLLKTMAEIDTLPRLIQSADGVSYAHKLGKQESRIDWSKSAKQIHDQVRGMNPWPGVFFVHNDLEIKVLKTTVINTKHNFEYGTVINDQLHVACGDVVLVMELLQKPGGKVLSSQDFLRGYAIPQNTRLAIASE
jgi:methionyl-tRNA formyltransferase